MQPVLLQSLLNVTGTRIILLHGMSAMSMAESAIVKTVKRRFVYGCKKNTDQSKS